MWIWLSLVSACLLGLYDVCKKKALGSNSVLWVLFAATGLSTLFLAPWLRAGTPAEHLQLSFKAVLVTTSWVSGLLGMKFLPLTTVSTIKGSRPVFVVLFSILLFGQKLALLQWVGVLLALSALGLLSVSSKKEVGAEARTRGFVHMGISVLAGVASALYDKYIMAQMEPVFVQSWSNLYITVILALCLGVQALLQRDNFKKFEWDWTLVIIAVLITVSDFIYFYSLKSPGSMLSIISVMRRSSVIFTFIFGALIFKERNVKVKAFALSVMAAGVLLLLLCTR